MRNARLALAKELRGLERDIMWNEKIYLCSKDQVQRDRVLGRLNILRARRVAIQMQIQMKGA